MFIKKSREKKLIQPGLTWLTRYTRHEFEIKNRSPNKDLTKKAQVKLKNTVNENARWHGLAWPIHSQNNKT